MINIQGREVLWDMDFAEKAENISLQMHAPTRKNVAFFCTEPWEGEFCNYGSLLYDGEKFRMYYRAAGNNAGVWQEEQGRHYAWCVAYSDDGKTFYKPNLGMWEFAGSKDNNIFLMDSTRILDNFAVTYDTNPACPPDEKYKALAQYDDPEATFINGLKSHSLLAYYKSADGIHFTFERILDLKCAFDSMNYAFWDETLGAYRLYCRGVHFPDAERIIEYEKEPHVRDIRLSVSKDFVNWSTPQQLDYGADDLEVQYYINNVQKYHRANAFIALPTRYIDREKDAKNYPHLPTIDGFRPMLTEKYGRYGTAITECAIMTGRDGLHFHRTHEAYLTPGIENNDNWMYGDGFFARGIIETQSDFRDEPKELSLFMVRGAGTRTVTFERYTTRMDGFFSWSANFAGGEVLTKPFTFTGEELTVNFATSALGYLHIVFCDEDGNAIPGYDSGRLFGNTIARPCDFEKSLADLNGKPVRMRIYLKDAQFYSFCFA